MGRTTIAADGSAEWAQTRYGNAATSDKARSKATVGGCTNGYVCSSFSCDACNAWECFKDGRSETSIRNVFLSYPVKSIWSRETLNDTVTNSRDGGFSSRHETSSRAWDSLLLKLQANMGRRMLEGRKNPLFLFLISISGLDWLFLYQLPPPLSRNPSSLKKRCCYDACEL